MWDRVRTWVHVMGVWIVGKLVGRKDKGRVLEMSRGKGMEGVQLGEGKGVWGESGGSDMVMRRKRWERWRGGGEW